MAKFQSPLLGYNNNVRHRGRIFHIQTEDSGVNHPHIITHLFMDGGRILKSVKKSYAEHVGTDALSETVKVMMKEQHKAMFIALRDGQFDELVDGQKAHEKKLQAEDKAKKDAAEAAATAAKKESDEVAKEAPIPSTAKEEEAPKHDEEDDQAAVAAAAAAAAADEAADGRDKDPSVELEIAVAEITLPDTEIDPDNEEIAAAAAAMNAATEVEELVRRPTEAALAAAAPALPPPASIGGLQPVQVPPPPSSDRLGGGVESDRSIGINDAPVMSMFSLGRSGEMPHASPSAGAAGPATNPDPSSPFDEAAPLTIPEDRRPRMSVPPPPPPGSNRHADELPPDLAALLANEIEKNLHNSNINRNNSAGAYASGASSGVDSNPNTTRDPERRRASAEELTLDFDALERDSSTVSAVFATTDLPPPPKNLFSKERGTGAYRAVDDDRAIFAEQSRAPKNEERVIVERTERERPPSRIPPSRPHSSPQQSQGPQAKPPRSAGGGGKPPSEGRYAPARPAAIFGSGSKAPPAGQAGQGGPPSASPSSSSIFSDDLVSDKSLDEVILSYLAEDLDPPRRK